MPSGGRMAVPPDNDAPHQMLEEGALGARRRRRGALHRLSPMVDVHRISRVVKGVGDCWAVTASASMSSVIAAGGLGKERTPGPPSCARCARARSPDARGRWRPAHGQFEEGSVSAYIRRRSRAKHAPVDHPLRVASCSARLARRWRSAARSAPARRRTPSKSAVTFLRLGWKIEQLLRSGVFHRDHFDNEFPSQRFTIRALR